VIVLVTGKHDVIDGQREIDVLELEVIELVELLLDDEVVDVDGGETGEDGEDELLELLELLVLDVDVEELNEGDLGNEYEEDQLELLHIELDDVVDSQGVDTLGMVVQ
jgi:hypothetical protein